MLWYWQYLVFPSIHSYGHEVSAPEVQAFWEQEDLSPKDCRALVQKYRSYAESYPAANDAALAGKTPKVFHMNAHHHAFHVLLRWRGRLTETLPLLHVDSHPDLGAVPLEVFRSLDAHDTVRLTDLRSMIQTHAHAAPELFDGLQRSINHCAQVVVPLIATGICDRVVFAVPPWFRRFPVDGTERAMTLVARRSRGISQRQILSVLQDSQVISGLPSSPFGCWTAADAAWVVTPSVPFQFVPAFDTDYLTRSMLGQSTQGYILSIDLDAFATNGNGTDREPISTHRSPEGCVAAREFSEVKHRIERFIDEIERLAAKGVLAKAVAIADSTAVDATRSHAVSDRQGNFAPACLAYLLHRKLEQFFEQLLAGNPGSGTASLAGLGKS